MNSAAAIPNTVNSPAERPVANSAYWLNKLSEKPADEVKDLAKNESLDRARRLEELINSSLGSNEGLREQAEELSQQPVSDLKELVSAARTASASSKKSLLDSKFIKQDLSFGVNVFSCFANSISAIANVLPLPEQIKSTASNFGSLATKASLTIYGLTGALVKLLTERNALSGFAYGMDIFNIIKYAQNELFDKRGLNSGLNFMAFGAKAYASKINYSSFTEYFGDFFKSTKEALSEVSLDLVPKEGGFATKLFGYLQNVTKNICSKKSGFLLMINGLGMMLGTLMMDIKPMQFLGQSVRNITGLLPDFVRMKDPVRQPNNFNAGLLYLLSTSLNYFKDITKFAFPEFGEKFCKVATPLTFAINDMARHFHFMSDNNHETATGLRVANKLSTNQALKKVA